MNKTFLRKFINVLSALAIISQSLTPYAVLLPQTASAQETTVTPTDTPTDTPTPTIDQSQPTDATPTPTVDQTNPSDTITPTPTDTPTDTVTPTPDQTATPTDTPTVDNNSPPSTDNSNTSNSSNSSNTGLSGGTSVTTTTPTVTVDPTQDGLTTTAKDGQLSLTILDNVSAPTVDLDAVVSQGSAALTTDKPDYAPTDTALITGSNLLPNTDYSLHIWSNDAPATSTTVTVTSDDSGKFAYAYQLDGTYRPNYSAELKDSAGNVVASTTFTDSAPTASIDLYSQCSNDQGTGYTSGDLGCRWTNGNLQHNNSAYFEGDATVQRVAIKDLATGNHTVTFEYDTTKGGKHAYDFITDDKFSENWVTNSDFCDPSLSNFASCSSSTPVLSALIPTDPNAAGHDTGTGGSNRHFTIRNGTWVNVGTPTLASGTYAGDSQTDIQVTFHVDTTTCLDKYQVQGADACEVLISFGTHVSTQHDWGSGNSAINISGSPYHVALAELDGSSIGQMDNQMQASAIVTTVPTVVTTIHNAAHQAITITTAGSTIHDSATVSGTGNNPPTATGTVDFTFYTSGDCTTGPVAAGTVALVSGVADPSTAEGPLNAGSYSFKAHYNGDSNYTPADATCEPLTVTGGTPSINTTPNPASGNVGVTLNDSAMLSNGINPTGTITFKLYGPSDATCTNTPAFTNQVTVNSGNNTYNTSAGFASDAAGTWHWSAIYSGDVNNSSTSSLCSEVVTISKYNSNTSTVIHDASHNTVTTVNAGSTIHDNATVSGAGPTPTGSVTFNWYTNGTCANAPTATSSALSLSNGSVDATGFAQGPLSSGSYSFKASYGGDNNYNGSVGTCEPLTVNKINPTFSTTIHDASHNPVTSVSAGSTVHDSATASGAAGIPTGTVDFTFYTSNNCTTGGSAAGTGVNLVSGTAHPSSSEGPLNAGSYSFKAHYNGDSNYNAVDATCEPLSVGKVTPSINTTPNPSTATVGDTLQDSADLSNGVNPTGSITFNLYSPSDATCANTPAFTNTVSVSGNGSYPTSSGFASNSTGTWHWTATYNGDTNNNSVSSGCADEPVTVNKADLGITTEVHNTSGDTAVNGTLPLGSTVHDKATVSGIVGSVAPSNNVLFTFYNNNSCTGDGVAAGSVALSGNVAHPSNSEGPLTSGGYSFKASILGDSNYNGATSDCEPISVGKADTTVTTQVHNSSHADITNTSVALGSNVHDSSTVHGQVGSVTPTGTITYNFYTNGTCSDNPSNSDQENVGDESTVQSNLGAGSYSYKASYSGDDNYNGSTGTCEPFNVNKARLGISTTIHDSNHNPVTSVDLGSIVHDTASVTGQVQGFSAEPVTFVFYSNSSCSGDGTSVANTGVDGNAVRSDDSNALSSGNYSYEASVAGNDNYTGATATCEPLTVNKANVDITTTLHDSKENVVDSETLDFNVHDSASVSGGIDGFTPTGTVDFTFYSGNACDSKGASAGTVSIDNNGIAHPSDTENLPTAGLYSFRAHYNGDNNYNGKTSACEPFTLTTLQINKVANGGDGTFDFAVDGPTSYDTNIDTSNGTGQTDIVPILSGNYSVTETGIPTGWDQIDATCGEDSSNTGYDVSAGTAASCSFTNNKEGKIIVTKYNDVNGNGVVDEGEGVLSGWTITLTGQTPQVTGQDGKVEFDNLTTGGYALNEQSQNGWEETNIYCDEGVQTSHGEFGDLNIPLNPGQTVNCSILNHNLLPKLVITKVNDTGGATKADGDTVGYTITVTVDETGGPATNVSVTDLLPQGFHYNGGSFSANSSDLGTLNISEPTYHSPGVWTLNDVNNSNTPYVFQPGDVITLKYTATIDGSEAAGTYYDNAWAQGTPISDSSDVIFADATTDPNLGNIGDPTFVGTTVLIAVPNDQSTGFKANVTQDVLGASTFLPATGEDTLWVIIATILGVSGFGTLFVGFKLRKKYEEIN